MNRALERRLCEAEKSVDYLENCIPIVSRVEGDPLYGVVTIDGRLATPAELTELERRENFPVVSNLPDMRSDTRKSEDVLFLSSRKGVRRATPAEAAEVKKRGMIPVQAEIPRLPIPQ